MTNRGLLKERFFSIIFSVIRRASKQSRAIKCYIFPLIKGHLLCYQCGEMSAMRSGKYFRLFSIYFSSLLRHFALIVAHTDTFTIICVRVVDQIMTQYAFLIFTIRLKKFLTTKPAYFTTYHCQLVRIVSGA